MVASGEHDLSNI